MPLLFTCRAKKQELSYSDRGLSGKYEMAHNVFTTAYSFPLYQQAKTPADTLDPAFCLVPLHASVQK